MNKNYNVRPLPGSVALFISSSSLLPSCSRVIWPLLFPHLYFFPSPLQYYLPLHPPSSPPTPSSSFSSFPLLLSKIENRTAGNWRSLSLLGPSGFAMPLATAHLCQTIFWSSFCLLFFPSSFFFSHKLHKPFLKLDFHLRWTRSARRVYAAFLPSIFLSLFFTSFQAVLSSISSCELSPLSPARTGAPFSSWRRFKEKKRRTLSSRLWLVVRVRWKEKKLRRSGSVRLCSWFSAEEGSGCSDLVRTSTDWQETPLVLCYWHVLNNISNL